MPLRFFQIDAFTSQLFGGNPAGVVPLETWLLDPVLQNIAAENNLSETAFIRPARSRDADYDLRWFTPNLEMDLCGHATLATAHVLWQHLNDTGQRLRFSTRSGVLAVDCQGDHLILDFPSRPAVRCELTDDVIAALGMRPIEVWDARDLMAVFDSEAHVRSLRPDMEKVAALDAFAVIATAPGQECDFVSRFFAPKAAVPEDPVTGSAHCTLIPYWSRRLDKRELLARQVSARGGELHCRDNGDRVHIGGRCVTYLEGVIHP